MTRDDLANEAPVAGQECDRRLVAVLLDEGGVAAQVGEQQPMRRP